MRDLAALPIRNHGEVFTRQWVVQTLLDLTGYTAERDLAALRLLEPSCGSGAFLGPAVERLVASARAYGRDLRELTGAIRAYDLQGEHVESARTLCRQVLRALGVDSSTAAKLVGEWIVEADFLLADLGDPLADVAIGNPPYIRYDDLNDATAMEYRRRWPTMRGRGDIFVGFFERCLASVVPDGRVGFICADRWMRNQYGAALRELVASRYCVEHVWTMHDVNAFQTQVSAYPAITVLANKRQGSAVVAETTSEFGAESAAALVAATVTGREDEFVGRGVKAHRLPHWFDGGDLWPTGSPARLALIELLNDKYSPLHDAATGTRVCIGIATGADRVYVTKRADVAEPDRMLPLAMRRDLASGTFDWQGNYLVNPWDSEGRLVSLADYPKLAAYLSQHTGLKDRFVARKSPERWHRTIDKVNASIIDRPKLLLQDMKATIHPVLEPGGYYPHHNLYYVVSDTWDMEVLGGLLLSRVAQAFIEAYCVKMRGGTLRFQAQYLKQIRVPRADSLDAAATQALREAFRDRDVEAASEAAGRAYGIDLDSYELGRPP
ncbi:MAG: Eco57I restriction-modification methylase domain-containing protein [Sporichthyaceae bacterium]